ncbi:MAG: KEOPS complex subunit Pcc1 [Candidatus Thermoplasmatota archaeon]
MNITCKLHITFQSKKQAEKILASIKVDDYHFVTSRQHDNTIHATITSTSLASLIHTLDDYLACISVAEKIVDKH